MSGDSPTTQGRPEPPPPPSPRAGRGPGLLWLWILIGMVVVAGVGVGAYLGQALDEEPDEGPDGPGPGNESVVSVQTGLCDPAAETTPIDVAIDPAGSATVTVTGGDGFEQTFSAAGGSSPVGAGDYTWTAQPGLGFTIAETTGRLTIAPCEEAQTGFTIQEQELLAHVPSPIRAACQPVAPEQQLGRAAGSLLCAHRGTTLFYDLFPNSSQMDTYYNSRVQEFDLTPGSGFCESAERAENAYVRTRGEQEFEVGRLMCFRDEDSAVFIWTDRRVHISVEAQRADRTNDQLYRRWARVEFGPLA